MVRGREKKNLYLVPEYDSQIRPNVTVRAFNAGLLASNSVCSRAVLRPANSIQIFRGFIGPTANVELVIKFHTVYCMLHTQPSNSKAPAQFLSSAHNNANFITLYPTSLHNALPYPSDVPLPERREALPGNLQNRSKKICFSCHP